MGEVTHFLGMKFQWTRHPDNHISALLTQEAFSDSLIALSGLSAANSTLTPYRSGHPVDSIPPPPPNYHASPSLKHTMQSLVGSLLWLSNATRLDLSTITSILSKYTHNPTPAHVKAAKFAIRYVKGTKDRGILFSSSSNHSLSAYLHFPTNPGTLLPICDANWGGSRSIPTRPFQSQGNSTIYIPLHIWLHYLT